MIVFQNPEWDVNLLPTVYEKENRLFTKHYFDPSFTELRDRNLGAMKKLRDQA